MGSRAKIYDETGGVMSMMLGLSKLKDDEYPAISDMTVPTKQVVTMLEDIQGRLGKWIDDHDPALQG